MRQNGVRTRERQCETIEEGKALYEAWCADAGNVGARVAARTTDADKRNLAIWREQLAPFGKSVADAVAHYLAHLERCRVSITVTELSDRFQTLKDHERKSQRYLSDLSSRLGRFCADFGDRVAAEISTEEINQWLTGLDSAPQTLVNYRRVVSTLFNYAVTLKACAENPVDRAMQPRVRRSEVGILNVREAGALLAAAAAPECSEILPAVAIGLFGGVRDAEIKRLDWRAVNFDTGFIEIKASTAKKGSRRLIALRPALRAWLQPYRRLSGPVWPAGERGRALHESARANAGLAEWPHNALRHSFASYTLAAEQNAPSLALEMGNSVPVLLQHYRELVTPAEAARFWNLLPETGDAPNVVPMNTPPEEQDGARPRTA